MRINVSFNSLWFLILWCSRAAYCEIKCNEVSVNMNVSCSFWSPVLIILNRSLTTNNWKHRYRILWSFYVQSTKLKFHYFIFWAGWKLDIRSTKIWEMNGQIPVFSWDAAWGIFGVNFTLRCCVPGCQDIVLTLIMYM